MVIVGVLAALLLVVVGGFAAGLLLGKRGGGVASAKVPQHVAEQLLFPLYLPTQLPSGYSLPANSYSVDDSTLFFHFLTPNGDKILATEEAKPSGFDFTAFYQQQLQSVKNLQHVPFSSVMGKTDQQELLLSIVTDKTWILIHGKTASEADLRAIAEHMKRQ